MATEGAIVKGAGIGREEEAETSAKAAAASVNPGDGIAEMTAGLSVVRDEGVTAGEISALNGIGSVSQDPEICHLPRRIRHQTENQLQKRQRHGRRL